MTLAWMFYALIVSVCFALAAYAAEWVLRAFRRPGRWVWAVAIVGTALVPMMAFLPERSVESEATLLEAPPAPMSPSVAAAFKWTAAKGTQVNSTVLLFWGSMSVLLLVVFTSSAVRIARERRRWRSADVAGSSVLVSRTTGPAIVGVGRSTIVIPEWVLDLGPDLQRLIIRHEEEHRSARDLWLAVGAMVAVVALPWNLALWWQTRRLRLAVEIDCDRRVLENGASVRSYAELLLASAEHRKPRIQPATMALAESSTSLERRIDDMTRTKIRSRATRSIVHGLAALGLVVVACDTPVPEAPVLSEQSADLHVKTKVALRAVVKDSMKVSVLVNMKEDPDRPLYVVDGVIMGASEINIDKLDIRSIEVVKGAAALALYGARASKVVVHITTVEATEQDAFELVPVKERSRSGN
ncbi:MAG: M56 family metallopeptidase [Gemmatimonadales bacterium]